MKVKLKDKCESIPKHSSHCGLSRDNWQKLNEGKSVNMDSIPEAAKLFLEEVKKGK
tara:strand:+ start:4283 stop:4450 length:168 start_codon:yes stop_codon:yes gene_type:complete